MELWEGDKMRSSVKDETAQSPACTQAMPLPLFFPQIEELRKQLLELSVQGVRAWLPERGVVGSTQHSQPC